MTTEIQAAVAEGDHHHPHLIIDDLRRQCERLRKERDEYRELLIKMRKKVAEVMHASLDDFK